MFFDNLDLFDDNDTEGAENGLSKDAVARSTYMPRMYRASDHSDSDHNGLKARADHWFYLKQFSEASKLYQQLLDDRRVTSAFLRRDLEEGVVRCCLALGDFEAAVSGSRTILEKTTDHDDFRIVALSLLLDVLEKSGLARSTQAREYHRSLVKILSLNPNMPRHWLKLADLYRHNHENHKAYICILNAKTFSASQFLDSTQDYLDKFCSEFSEFNRLGVAGGGGGHRAGDRESKAVAGQDENEDFTDLGSSARLRGIEARLASSSGPGQAKDSGANEEDQIINFEKKWLT